MWYISIALANEISLFSGVSSSFLPVVRAMAMKRKTRMAIVYASETIGIESSLRWLNTMARIMTGSIASDMMTSVMHIVLTDLSSTELRAWDIMTMQYVTETIHIAYWSIENICIGMIIQAMESPT